MAGLPDIRGLAESELEAMQPCVLRALCVANGGPNSTTNRFNQKRIMVPWLAFFDCFHFFGCRSYPRTGSSPMRLLRLTTGPQRTNNFWTRSSSSGMISLRDSARCTMRLRPSRPAFGTRSLLPTKHMKLPPQRLKLLPP